MSFCWRSIFVTKQSHENSCQCFDAFLVPFTASFSRQNLELLIPEGTFTYISSSVRACTYATLMSTTRTPKSLQLAALPNIYLTSHKQIIFKPLGLELTHTDGVVISTGDLAIHQPKPCHRRMFQEATHPLSQTCQKTTCFATQVLGRFNSSSGNFSTQ